MYAVSDGTEIKHNKSRDVCSYCLDARMRYCVFRDGFSCYASGVIYT